MKRDIVPVDPPDDADKKERESMLFARWGDVLLDRYRSSPPESFWDVRVDNWRVERAYICPCGSGAFRVSFLEAKYETYAECVECGNKQVVHEG